MSFILDMKDILTTDEHEVTIHMAVTFTVVFYMFYISCLSSPGVGTTVMRLREVDAVLWSCKWLSPS